MNNSFSIAAWLGERARDAALWPVNLIRDFPVRFGRLSHTIGAGLGGVASFAPEMSRTIGQRDLRPWLRQKAGKTAAWTHLFAAQLFDLMGGPEIAQFWMRLISNTTPLTDDEIAMITSVLGPNAMRYGDVRVAEGGLFDLIFKLNGNLAFAAWHTVNLPRFGCHTRANLPVVVHELAHVYQYECVGSRYLGEAVYMLITTRRDCYAYGSIDGLNTAVTVGKRFSDYNREQQAQIVQDYYTLRQMEADLTAYNPFITQLRAGKL